MGRAEQETGTTVVIIGAGPVGLAAAAHLLERGLEPVVLEAGAEIGSAVREWGHVRLFSPWRYNVDPAARRVLESTGWQEPDPEKLPLGSELVEEYLAPLAMSDALSGRIHTDQRVVGVSREGVDKVRTLNRESYPYLVRTVDAGGRQRDRVAAAVIDASGTWGRSNPLGRAGLQAPGEADASSYLTGPLPDVAGRDYELFAGKHVLVAGMGHSAANSLLALAELRETEPETTVTWVIRGDSPERLYGGGDADGLPARGALGGRLKKLVEAGDIELIRNFVTSSFEPAQAPTRGPLSVVGQTPDGTQKIDVDVVVPATGFRPELEMLREVRLDLEPGVEAPSALAPMIDPNFHSCGTVPPHGERELAHSDQGFYIAGMKSYGRAPTFLLATGYEQVRSISAALAGDRAAADAVELELPETGVCSADSGADAPGEQTSECCGTPEPPSLPRGFSTGFEHGYSGEADSRTELDEDSCCTP